MGFERGHTHKEDIKDTMSLGELVRGIRIKALAANAERREVEGEARE